jgi:glycosyltransferase involved in cell wall biosynthesis
VSDSLFGLSETNVKAHLLYAPINISNVDFKSIDSNAEVITQGVIISPGIDMQAFENKLFNNTYTFPWKKECQDNQKLLYKSSACFVVAFVARLAKEKAVGLFLVAMRDLLRIRPMVRVMVIGDGSLRHEFESLASKLGIRWAVKFIGWQPRQLLPLIYADVDVLVNTGISSIVYYIAYLYATKLDWLNCYQRCLERNI